LNESGWGIRRAELAKAQNLLAIEKAKWLDEINSEKKREN